MKANDEILAQCVQYTTGFGEGADFGLVFFGGLFVFFVLMVWLFNVVNKAPYLPFAPTLAELERRKYFLELLIERKKKQLQKEAA